MSNNTSSEDEHRTRFEREIRLLEKRKEGEKAQLRSKLRQLGISSGRRSLEDVSINPQQFLRRHDTYGYMQAKRARSLQNNLQTTIRRLETVRHRHESVKSEKQKSESK